MPKKTRKTRLPATIPQRPFTDFSYYVKTWTPPVNDKGDKEPPHQVKFYDLVSTLRMDVDILSAVYGETHAKIVRCALDDGIDKLRSVPHVSGINVMKAVALHRCQDERECESFYSEFSNRTFNLNSSSLATITYGVQDSIMMRVDKMASDLGLSPAAIRNLAMMAAFYQAYDSPYAHRQYYEETLIRFVNQVGWIYQKVLERYQALCKKKLIKKPRNPRVATSFRNHVLKLP